ncbi:MAG: hypothetical protein OXH67_14455 [Acidimicrobiaceae bacterium]|nr:hypothetical protein [Acidimicrobiaceae bacterium]
MTGVVCRGLPGEWLNGWLAAIGLLVLEPRLSLSWTREHSPSAVLTADGEDPLSLAAGAWPPEQRLNAMPIAEHLEGLPDMRRSVSLEVFRSRAELGRRHPDSWTLSSSVTDLCVDVGTESTVRHAPLDPKGPDTVKWLHHRLTKSHSMVEQPSNAIPSSLEGHGRRVVDNGLGFDASRITGPADSAGKLVDPVIEVLAFFGLRVLPMRGDGVEIGKSGPRPRFAARQRCWHLDTTQSSRGQCMTWPSWSQALDLAGVDALLDLWSDLIERAGSGHRVLYGDLERLGIHAAWRTRPYQPRGSGDTTVGFTSARVELGAPRP